MIEPLRTKFERVMIIDDTIIDLYIASQVITKNNFGKTILEYSNSKKALNYLQENQEYIELLPQVIFLDLYMPIMSGFQFLEEYEKLSSTLKKYCKIFVISSTSSELDINRIRSDKNIAGFSEKPIAKFFLNTILN
jgi:CheY-like chemotaxis protein